MKWAQTDPQSCGAAALMVALSEAGIGAISAERETELWAKIRATGSYPGSLPGRIALEAQRQGVVPTVWIDTERIDSLRKAVGDRAAFDVPALLAEHAAALEAARQAGVRIEQGSTDPRDIVQTIRQGSALMAGFVVAQGDGRMTLHWRLYRFTNDAIWEMDPDGGKEVPKAENQFVELLSSRPYLGIAVTLRRVSST
jgi:hypothetical protein